MVYKSAKSIRMEEELKVFPWSRRDIILVARCFSFGFRMSDCRATRAEGTRLVFNGVPSARPCEECIRFNPMLKQRATKITTVPVVRKSSNFNLLEYPAKYPCWPFGKRGGKEVLHNFPG
ncbi:hypothetical protein M2133_002329 [Parabacteroides sp. PF5-6]|nr:hypothetical protein [Parabacteroides sp. PF5-6]